MRGRAYDIPYDSGPVKFADFHSRWEFILKRCRGKSVLHLGCIGETEKSINDKVEAMLGTRLLHAELRKGAREVVGVDYDLSTVEELRKKGFKELVYGDVENLGEVQLNRAFGVVLCGDLVEHLSLPGRMFEGLKRIMDSDSELLITTPNSFGLLHFLRYAVNRFTEGNDHVSSFSVFTLRNLLRRHGFRVTEIYTCYNRPPRTWQDRFRYGVGSVFFSLYPKFGGTLLVVAKLEEGK